MIRNRMLRLLKQPLYHTAQNLVRPPAMRRFLGRLEAATRPSFEADLSAPQAREIHDALRDKGHTEDFRPLAGAQVEEMRAWLLQAELRDPRNLAAGGFRWESPKEGCRRGFVPLKHLVRTPHIFALANHPGVLAAMGATFGCKPQVAMMQAFWRFPAEGPEDYTESWHRDFETLRFIKIFLYLTDVTLDSGPHYYVEGSHLEDRIRKMGFASDKEIRAAYGDGRVIAKLGSAGTCFAEETNGWHKGDQVRGRPRLMLQVVYAVRPVLHRDRPLLKAGEIRDPGFEGFDRYVFQNHILP